MTSCVQRKRLSGGEAGVVVSVVGHLQPLLNLQLSALSPIPSLSLLCLLSTPWKQRHNHPKAQGCPLSWLTVLNSIFSYE